MNYSEIINKSKNEKEFFDNFKKLNIKFNTLLIEIKNNKDVLCNLLKLLNVNVDLFFNLLNIIKVHYSCCEYKRIYCYEYNLILILQMKNNINNWKSLQKLIICDSNYNNVYKQFKRWSQHNLFKKAFLNYVPNVKNEDLIIDTTSCSNKTGIENIVINSEYTKKR